MTVGYLGPERRRHRAYVTRNTEYHFRDDVCVAVRDIKSRRMAGFAPGGRAAAQRRRPRDRQRLRRSDVCSSKVGESLYFGEDGRELVTSALCRVERPEREVVHAYP